MSPESFQAILAWVAANPGWMGAAIFVSSLAEALTIVGVIIPGAIIMFSLGALIGLGQLEFWPAYAWAAAGAVVGDALSFWLGRAFHQHLRQLWPFSRHPNMLLRGEAFFQRHGGKSILLARFFGPVRGTLPTVAGMLDMPWGRFLVVNVVSALLWAPAYLIPGMVFGASLELASQVAWRLVVLILLVVMLLWGTVWLVRVLVLLLQPRLNGWLQTFAAWSHGRPLIGPISASLLDPAQGELRGLAILAVLLLGIIVLLSLIMNAAGQNLPTALDQSLYRFLQDLRTPWADNMMVFIAELGSPPVKLSLTIAVFVWLYWRRFYSAARHWLGALGFGLATNTLFTWLFKVPPPSKIYPGIFNYSFPSNHATLTTILFGFLSVLVARETPLTWRWIPYLTAALIILPTTLSKLYLGAFWLTDALAGLSLGLIWVALLSLAYNRHPAPRLDSRGLLVVSLVALVASDLAYTGLHHQDLLQRYKVNPTLQVMSWNQWWQGGWQHLPTQRLDFRHRRQQGLVLQWAGPRAELELRLGDAGWREAPALTLQNALMWLSPQARLADLPVLPQVHDGGHEDLTLAHPGETPDTRWVLRFWDIGVRLTDDNNPRLWLGDLDKAPLWLGSLSLQGQVRRMNFFTLAVELPYTELPSELLAPALQGLRSRVVTLPAEAGTITLIAQ